MKNNRDGKNAIERNVFSFFGVLDASYIMWFVLRHVS